MPFALARISSFGALTRIDESGSWGLLLGPIRAEREYSRHRLRRGGACTPRSHVITQGVGATLSDATDTECEHADRR